MRHDGKYYIIDGHHRFKAAKMAGIKDIPIKVIDDIKNHPSNWESIAEVISDAEGCGLDKIKFR